MEDKTGTDLRMDAFDDLDLILLQVQEIDPVKELDHVPEHGVEAPVLRGLLVEADVGQVHLANPEILHATEFGHVHAQVLAVIHESRGARGACEHLVHEIAQLA